VSRVVHFCFLLGDNFCNSAKHELDRACKALQRTAMGTIIHGTERGKLDGGEGGGFMSTHRICFTYSMSYTTGTYLGAFDEPSMFFTRNFIKVWPHSLNLQLVLNCFV
jgi:hypothetical protein